MTDIAGTLVTKYDGASRGDLIDRLSQLEKTAWRLLIHDACKARREGRDLCAEGVDVLDYFETHGVLICVVDENGNLVSQRVPPTESMVGPYQ